MDGFLIISSILGDRLYIKSFPKAIKDLTSLKSLTLTNCSDLIER